jgi:hypothetical protein
MDHKVKRTKDRGWQVLKPFFSKVIGVFKMTLSARFIFRFRQMGNGAEKGRTRMIIPFQADARYQEGHPPIAA